MVAWDTIGVLVALLAPLYVSQFVLYRAIGTVEERTANTAGQAVRNTQLIHDHLVASGNPTCDYLDGCDLCDQLRADSD